MDRTWEGKYPNRSYVPSYLQFQSKEPEESERSRGQDSLTDQKQADSVVGSLGHGCGSQGGEGKGNQVGGGLRS